MQRRLQGPNQESRTLPSPTCAPTPARASLSRRAGVGWLGLRFRTRFRIGWCVLLLLASGSGCRDQPPQTQAQVEPADLPVGGDWTGVFYSPVYGHLHLVKEGKSVSGRWRTKAGDKWGELHGTTTGDLLRYKWTEHKIGLVGPGAKTEGHGYFKYVVPPNERDNHELKGQWGLGAAEVGSSWDAIRQRNMLPELDSVLPDEVEAGSDLSNGWE